MQRDVAVGEVVGQGGAGDVAVAGGHGVVLRVDQPGAGLAGRGQGGDLGVLGHVDVGGGGFDETAVAAAGRAGVQGATDVDLAGLHAAQQNDGAVAVIYRARFNHAGVVDDAGEQGVLRAGTHQDLATISLEQTAVGSQAAQHALVHLQVQQAVATEGQCRSAARAQRHRTQPGGDDALVADLVAEQGDVAAVGRMDRALVNHAAAALAAETAGRAAEAGVVHIQAGGNQSADVDLRTLAEQDAVRVDQIDLAVGIEVAQDLCAIGVEDAVDRERAGRRLQEVDGFLRRDVETVPVQRQILAGLLDGGGIATLTNTPRTGHDLATARSSLGQKSGQRQGSRHQFGAGRLASPPGDFRNCNPGVQHQAPDDTINVVEGCVLHDSSQIRLH